MVRLTLRFLAMIAISQWCLLPALAGDGKHPLSSCLKSMISEKTVSDGDKARVIELLDQGTLHQAPERYLSIKSRDGKIHRVKVVGCLEKNGKPQAKVIIENGTATLLDPEKTTTLMISEESRTFWENKHAELIKNLKEKTLDKGDAQYLTLDAPDHEGTFLVRVVGYIELGKETLPTIMLPDGEIKNLTPWDLDHAFSSLESKKFWLGTQDGSNTVIVRKHIHELPKKNADLLLQGDSHVSTSTLSENALPKIILSGDPSSPPSDPDFKAVLIGQGNGKTRIERLSKALDQKMGVKVIHSSAANEKNHSAAFSMKDATLKDESGKPIFLNQEIINASSYVKTGGVSSTEIHEIGHAKTNRNVMEGKPDPLAVKFHALPGEQLPGGSDYSIPSGPNFYPLFSSADEVRQHAYDFHNLVHQRVTSEVISDFSKKMEIEAYKVFGINLENFHSSLGAAKKTLDHLLILNLRNTELAMYAQERILRTFNERSPPNSGFEFHWDQAKRAGEIRITTSKGKVTVPIIGKAFDSLLNPLIIKNQNDTQLNLSQTPGCIPKLKVYVHDYLSNLIHMMDQQFNAIQKSRGPLEKLSQRPFTGLNQEKYLKLQNTFTKVKTTVNFSPDKVQNLQWVDPGFPLPPKK
ncbi:MAG: hypothetical protein KGP28_07695 [Bdellovibrionales bacterium]|nr:hypothetical protein [Bdellovibrionales bacterium]